MIGDGVAVQVKGDVCPADLNRCAVCRDVFSNDVSRSWPVQDVRRAIQVARNVVGATVIATTSTDEKARMAGELGADSVVNYTTEDVAARVKELTGGLGADVVLDHVGADAWPAATAALAAGGRYGICGVTSGYRAELQMGTLFLKQQTILGVFMGRSGDLRQIVQMAGRGVIRGVIHTTYPLQDAAKAHEEMEAQSFFGKLVLTVP